MDDNESAQQIAQMVNFILNEAKDKAEEIDARALEEYNIEKMRVGDGMKDKIRGEYTKKKKQADTQKAIARSTAINRARLQKIEARQHYMTELKSVCGRELKSFIRSKDKYANLLVDLIVQGCLKLMEDSVQVRCKKDEVQLVQGVLDKAATRYAKTLKEQCRVPNLDKSVKLSVDTSAYLPSASAGGVELMCNGGAIKVDNTLDTRLSLVMKNDLPSLRKIVFPSAVSR